MTKEEVKRREYDLGYQFGRFLARDIIRKHLGPEALLPPLPEIPASPARPEGGEA